MQNQNETAIYNVDEIRDKAKRSLSQGAVTEGYPLDIDHACRLLNEALASEILCVLRYRHHQVVAKGINYIDIAAEFEEHANEEMEHTMVLAERINQLGGDPDFNPSTIMNRSATEYGHEFGDDLMAMIREDLVAERIAIDVYRKMIAWFGSEDPTTRRLLERILEEEEKHASDLSDLLANSTSPLS